jgi:hypothetical protein
MKTLFIFMDSAIESCKQTNVEEYDFLSVMTLYIAHLKMDRSTDTNNQDNIKILNEEMVKLEPFKKFAFGNANDSITYMISLVHELHKYGIVEIRDATKTQIMRENLPVQNVATPDIISFGICDIGSCKYDRVEPCSHRIPRIVKLDYTPSEKMVTIPIKNENSPDVEKEVSYWNIELENTPYVRNMNDDGTTCGKIIFRTIKDHREFSLDSIVSYHFKNAGLKLPDILIIRHMLETATSHESMMIPCALYVDDSTYTLHGASLYDCVHSNGHYTSVIVSSTTMFVYDPEYNVGIEDMRIYRVRYLCYLKI